MAIQPEKKKRPCADTRAYLLTTGDGGWQWCACCGEWTNRRGVIVRPIWAV